MNEQQGIRYFGLHGFVLWWWHLCNLQKNLFYNVNYIRFFVNCQHWQYCHICHFCTSIYERLSYVYVMYPTFSMMWILSTILLELHGWLAVMIMEIDYCQMCHFCIVGYLRKTIELLNIILRILNITRLQCQLHIKHWVSVLYSIWCIPIFSHMLIAPPSVPQVSGLVIQTSVWIPRSTHCLLVLSVLRALFFWMKRWFTKLDWSNKNIW